ncbi:MAG: hypothetical protein NTV32_04770 [Gammaproteobacteria bacterium]|nr:hypothetical protein [Gammaproteobacteria bacterium]
MLLLLLWGGLLHRSKTRIVEEAILDYAEKNQVRRGGLFSLAGSLSESDADLMLSIVQQGKTRKELAEIL